MSLINDALKKAQRDRDPLPPTDALGAGSSGRPRGRTPARHWLLVLGSGALVLVVLSVAFTLFWTTPDTPPRKTAAAAPAAHPAPAPAATAPAPSIVPVLPAARPAAAEAPPTAATIPPAQPTPAVKAAPATNPAPAATSRAEPPSAPPPAKSLPATPPTTAAASPEPVTPSAPARPANGALAAPVAAAPANPPAPPAAPPRPDEKINTFIGTLRVAGVRALGEDSRVLINDRVYRVNDVIDRTLGIRLVKVEPGSLHFVDGRGVAYVKYL